MHNQKGYQGRHCPHGRRSSSSMIMNEAVAREVKTDEGVQPAGDRPDLMLAHLPKEVSETERI